MAPAPGVLMAPELGTVAHTVEAAGEAVQFIEAAAVEAAAVFQMEYPYLHLRRSELHHLRA